MTLENAQALFQQAPLETLRYAGIKLLTPSAQDSVEQRIAILREGIQALAISSGLRPNAA